MPVLAITTAPATTTHHNCLPAPVCYLSLSGGRRGGPAQALPGPAWDPTKRQLS